MQNLSCFGQKASMCVLPIDDFTGEIYKGNISIYIDGICAKAIKKPSGMYIYVGLHGCIKLTVKAYRFKLFDESIDVEKLNPLNPIVHVRLKADENYKFLSGVSGVRFAAKDKKGNILSNAQVKAFLNDMSSFAAFIEDDVKKNDKEIKLCNVYDSRIECSSFKIISNKDDGKDEYILLGQQLKDGKYEVLSDLNFEHSNKDKLMNAYMTTSDAQGNILIAFNKLYKSISKLTVEVSVNKTFEEVSFDIFENRIVDMDSVMFK